MREKERDKRKKRKRNNGVEGFIEGEREELEGVEGFGGANNGWVREGVDELGHEKSKGHHPLRLHPFDHRHRYELWPQTPIFPASQPRLIRSFSLQRLSHQPPLPFFLFLFFVFLSLSNNFHLHNISDVMWRDLSGLYVACLIWVNSRRRIRRIISLLLLIISLLQFPNVVYVPYFAFIDEL